MKITRIENQKKRPGRKNIYADGEFLIGVGAETLLAFGLRTGDEITPEKLGQLEKTEEALGAKTSALRFLSARPRSVREVRDKLREKEYGDEEIGKTIEELIRSGLLNDDAFARMFIRNARAIRPAGTVLLKKKLLLLGLGKEVIESALEDEFSPEDQQADAAKAAAAFLKKSPAARRAEDPKKLKERLATFLLRRGFEWEIAEPVVRRLTGKGSSKYEDPFGE